MMTDKYPTRVNEFLHRKGDYITEAEYVYDEIHPNRTKRQYRVHVRREEFERIAATLKKPTLTFESFTKVVRPFLMGFEAVKDIPEAFQLLDADNSDTIDINELAVFMPAIVPDSNPYMLLRYFEKADTNSDYKLSLEEFTAFVEKGVIRDLALGRL
jgi:Ca2+-binding EF-hand superfamily protein